MGRQAIHQKWFQLSHMSELTEYLQSIPSFELTKKIALQISEESFPTNPMRMVVENFITQTKSFMQDVYDELQPELEIHSYNYPFMTARIPFVSYESSNGCETFARIQSRLRKIPGLKARYSPRKIQSPVIPIILPGVDYSAESLVNSLVLENEGLPDKDRKSTRLNSSHRTISYAVFCLKKKK